MLSDPPRRPSRLLRRALGVALLVSVPAGVALAGGEGPGGVAVEWLVLVALGLLPGWLFARRALG